MRRYIVLLLITGTVWAQTGLDKLVLKDGTEYLGKYLKTEKGLVYFKSFTGTLLSTIAATLFINDIFVFRKLLL